MTEPAIHTSPRSRAAGSLLGAGTIPPSPTVTSGGSGGATTPSGPWSTGAERGPRTRSVGSNTSSYPAPRRQRARVPSRSAARSTIRRLTRPGSSGGS